ncbi:Cytochrome P450 [Sesbania bispinosa]|nr:Cytochrome P450 [Sesbania bispinosa]
MHLKLGEVSHIVVTSPEIAKEILKTHDLNFCDRPKLLLATVLTYNITDIAFSPYGEYWRQLRKICTIELLSAKRVQSFRSIRETEVSEFVKTITACEGSVVNLSHKIFSMTYGIVARAAFGKKNRHQEVFKSRIEEALNLLGGFCVADLYPSIRVLRWMSSAKVEMGKLQRELDRILQDIIDDYKNKKSGNHQESGEDLVDVLLKCQQENDSEDPLTDDNIKAVIQL